MFYNKINKYFITDIVTFVQKCAVNESVKVEAK